MRSDRFCGRTKMEFERTETVRSTPSRHEKSLGLLTMKFVSLLQEAKDGVLDLKVVSETESMGSALLFVIMRVMLTCRPTILTAHVNKGFSVTSVASQVHRRI